MLYEYQNNKLIAKSLIPTRKLLLKTHVRFNVTGFSDIDYAPTAGQHSVLPSKTPNCGIVEKEGDLYLMSIREIQPGEQLSANFENSRYLKNKQKDKPNMDSPTLNSSNHQNYSELMMGANFPTTETK